MELDSSNIEMHQQDVKAMRDNHN
uniref:Uncharacterized protein n=1 Tax=Tetranychus urticae TaxID=32264 RepID=T1KDX8_TETUR